MNTDESISLVPATASGCELSEVSIAELVGELYEAAPPLERSRMIERLLQPLGVLSIVAVANGIFAKVWFRTDWHELKVTPEDIQSVRSTDVVALVDYVQQASVDAIDSLARMLASSPVSASSAVAALLVALLVQRVRSLRGQRTAGDAAAATTRN